MEDNICLFTIKEASKELDITEEEILKKIKAGSIFAKKRDEAYLIPRSEITRIRFDRLGSCIT